MSTLNDLFYRLRNSEDRWEAILELKMSHNKEWEPQLITFLKDSDWVVRWCVAEKLGDLGELSSVEPLILLLSDFDAHVRRNAMKALEKFEDKMVPIAVPYLAHENVRIRRNLCKIFVALGNGVIPILRQEMVKHNRMIGTLVLYIIYEINPDTLPAILKEALFITSLQKIAIVLLGLRGDSSILPTLLPLYAKPDLRRVILYSIKLMGKKESFLFIVRLLNFPDIVQYAEQIIIKIGQPILPNLVVALTKPGFSKEYLLHLIFRIGPEKVMDKLDILVKKNAEIDQLVASLKKQYTRLPQLDRVPYT